MVRKTLFIIILILFVELFYGEDKKFSFEFYERIRYVNWDNAIDLNKERSDKFSFTRQKTSLSFNWKPSNAVDLKIKLTNENRIYFLPDDRDYNIDEIIFDQLYIKLNKIFGIPLSISAGRQNIIMGEGFLLLDYHPLDGSRSNYFDALRGDYKFSKDAKLTMFYGSQDVNDDLLPIINSRDKKLIERPEEGYGLYYSGLINNVKLETYYIRKNIKDKITKVTLSGINTFGFRTIFQLKNNLSLTSELAYQQGYKDELDRSAYGGYFHLDYKFNKRSLLSVFTIGGFYLSGDDKSTDKYEGWDPLFSRWPKWSESYIYTLIKENGVAYWSNIISLNIGFKMSFTPQIGLDVKSHLLIASQNTGTINNFLSGIGKNRGLLFTSKLNMKFNNNLSGHFVFETFNPGDFYVDDASSYYWFRFELLYKYRK